MKKMIFVTNSFPFSIQESSFIRPEIKELLKVFEITIVSRSVSAQQTTSLPDGVRILRYDPKKDYNTIGLFLKTVFSSAIYKEIARLEKAKKLSLKNLKKALKYYMRSLHFAQFLRPVRNEIKEDVTLYTYWNDFSVLSLSMIKKENDKLVSRAHGIDLYERNDNNGYLPMKSFSNEKTDFIAFISDAGKQYFEKNFGTNAQKEVYRLGAASQTPVEYTENDTLSIYSFSYISPVKRVEIIAKTLNEIDNINIKWTHIGAGVREKEVKKITESLLDKKENITYHFTGAMENKDAMQYISKSDFEVLVNVSESEGLPVTMMEAMSFAIPVIATKVGGVSEIVKNGYNGLLIENDENICENLKNAILDFYKKDKNEKIRLKTNAYNTWSEKYNSELNERQFAERISEL